jgi:hypothetical protein
MASHEKMSSHNNVLKALIQQPAQVCIKVEEDDAKAVLLNNLPLKYSNIVFTLRHSFTILRIHDFISPIKKAS